MGYELIDHAYNDWIPIASTMKPYAAPSLLEGCEIISPSEINSGKNIHASLIAFGVLELILGMLSAAYSYKITNFDEVCNDISFYCQRLLFGLKESLLTFCYFTKECVGSQRQTGK